MIGNPKYKIGDLVSFIFDGIKKTGIVEIVDEYGTFGDNTDVSYDIYIKDENCLYKHIKEIGIIKEKRI